MLYIVCPTCGYLLGNKEEIYYKKISDLCEEYGVDDNMLSSGILNNDKEFIKKKKKILDDLIGKHNICCASRIPTNIDLVRIIKG